MADATRIVIIGGGASGTIAATHLLHEFSRPLKIYIVEKRQQAIFRGIAYSSNIQFEPLNVPAGRMSIFSDLPNDFLDWLKENRAGLTESPITTDSYVSRRWFGDYLTDRLAEAKSKAPQASFKLIISEAIDIIKDKKNTKYEVRLADGSSLQANYIVFATGHEPPADILNNIEKALLGEKYITNPWISDPFKNLAPNDDVLIIGSGLSMVDHAVSLLKKKHAGKIYSFSRHGLLPLPQFAGREGHVNFNIDTRQILEVFRELRSATFDAEKKGVHWQQIINSIRDEVPGIWQRLSIASKRTFLNRLKHFWEIHRHRMPAESAEILESMRQSGKLEMLAGKRTEIIFQNGKLQFEYITKKDKITRAVKIDYVINCTGPSGNYSGHSNQLVRNLLARGWMKQDSLQLGIETGPNGEIMTVQDIALPNVYGIGPVRKATEWESTAIREIKIQAEQLALEIALIKSEARQAFVLTGL
jgi:uncharacterized NAD(P)/FAD-binding protein YdhS